METLILLALPNTARHFGNMTNRIAIMQDIRDSKATALAFMTVGLCWGSFAALVPDLKSAIDASDGAFGMAMFIASFGAVCALWIAPRVDKSLGPRAMQAGSLAMALAFLIPGLLGNTMAFAFAMLAASATSATLDVVMNTRVSQVEARVKRPLMNLNHGIFSLAYATSALVTGVFRSAGADPFWVFATMGAIICALVLGMYLEAPETADQNETSTHVPVLLVIVGGLIILIAFLSEQATEAWSALHLERGLGGSAAQGAMGPAILGLTMGIGRIGGQLVLGKLRETVVIAVASLIASLGLYIAATAESLGTAYLGFAILGTGVSVTAPLAYSAIGKRVDDKNRTIVITRISVIGYTGFFLGPPMMGGLSELYGLPVSFLAVSGMLLMITVILAPALRRIPAR